MRSIGKRGETGKVCSNMILRNKGTGILTLFAFGRKMYYLCNSEAGLSIGKSRFFGVFKVFPRHFWAYCFLKIPVLQFKFQVFVLKFRYGLFQFQCLK